MVWQTFVDDWVKGRRPACRASGGAPSGAPGSRWFTAARADVPGSAQSVKQQIPGRSCRSCSFELGQLRLSRDLCFFCSSQAEELKALVCLQQPSCCLNCTACVCVCVCLHHITQFFPQLDRLGGVQLPRKPTAAAAFLCLHEATSTERWRRGRNPGKCRPFGFFRIGIYVLGFV